jgi:hypothetical protein
MAIKVVINRAGLERAMKSPEAAAAARRRAEDAAEVIRGMGIEVGASDGGGRIPLPVEVVDDPSIEGVALVLAHPSGEAVQAKYGALTKAAAQVGLTVEGA